MVCLSYVQRMSEEWKALTDDQKLQYQQESDRAREHYQKEMVEFKAKQAKQKAAEAAAGGEVQVGKKRPAAQEKGAKAGKGTKAAAKGDAKKAGKASAGAKAAAKPAGKQSAAKKTANEAAH